MSRFHLFVTESTPQDQNKKRPTVFVELLQHDLLDDHVLLTPGCQTGVEIDEWIDRLITQLNAVRNKAKDELTDSLRE